MAEDIAAEKLLKDTEYQAVQRKLQDAAKDLAQKRKQLEELRSQSEQLELVNISLSGLETAKGLPETFDWRGRPNLLDQLAEKDVPLAFRPRKESLGLSDLSIDETELLTEHALTSQSSRIDELIVLRRMKIWHERIGTLLTRRLAPKGELVTEKEHQLRKLVALCTGFSTTEADEVCVFMSSSSEAYASDVYSKSTCYSNPSRVSPTTSVKYGLRRSWIEYVILRVQDPKSSRLLHRQEQSWHEHPLLPLHFHHSICLCNFLCLSARTRITWCILCIYHHTARLD